MSINISNPVSTQNFAAEATQVDSIGQNNLDKTKGSGQVTIPSPPSPVANSGDLPSLPSPKMDTNSGAIIEWGPMASPAALIMSLMVEGASGERKANRENMQVQGQALIQSIKDEAAEIRSNAVTQLVCGIVGGALQIAGGLASGLIAGGVGPMGKGGDMLVAGRAQAFTTASGGASGITNAVGQYLDSMSRADQKDMQTAQEKLRISRDELKSFNDSLQELIGKVISSMDAIQSNMNQTRTRILG